MQHNRTSLLLLLLLAATGPAWAQAAPDADLQELQRRLRDLEKEVSRQGAQLERLADATSRPETPQPSSEARESVDSPPAQLAPRELQAQLRRAMRQWLEKGVPVEELQLEQVLAQAYYRQGRMRHRREGERDFDGALADYDRALKLDPSLGDAHYHRGAVLIDLKRFREALVELDRAQELGGEFEPNFVNFMQGVAHFHLSQWKESDRHLQLFLNWSTPEHPARERTLELLELVAEALLERPPPGEELYRSYCSRCHQPNGGGNAAFPSLLESKLSLGEFTQVVKSGKGFMPPSPDLSSEDCQLLYDYLRRLRLH